MIYLGYSSYIFTNGVVTIDDQNVPLLLKRNKDWKLAELSDGNKYKCLFSKMEIVLHFLQDIQIWGKNNIIITKKSIKLLLILNLKIANHHSMILLPAFYWIIFQVLFHTIQELKHVRIFMLVILILLKINMCLIDG